MTTRVIIPSVIIGFSLLLALWVADCATLGSLDGAFGSGSPDPPPVWLILADIFALGSLFGRFAWRR